MFFCGLYKIVDVRYYIFVFVFVGINVDVYIVWVIEVYYMERDIGVYLKGRGKDYEFIVYFWVN